MQRAIRIKKELEKLKQNPLAGVTFWTTEDIYHLEASIIGPDNSPYENGIFKLDIRIPERYPFEPPKLRFVTPVYHPNIDNSGRICLDVLKSPPNGTWKPTRDLGGVLTSIQLLLSEPNPDDPLMTEIADEFRKDYSVFVKNAKEWTQNHAVSNDKATDGATENNIAGTSSKSPPSKRSRLMSSEN